MEKEVRQPRRGLAWHMYHDHLMTYCWDYEQRVRAIKTFKPEHEVPTRLKRFQFVEGELPLVFRGASQNSDVSALVAKNRAAVEALHRKECPNCPWNGLRLVFPGYWLRAWRWLCYQVRRG